MLLQSFCGFKLILIGIDHRCVGLLNVHIAAVRLVGEISNNVVAQAIFVRYSVHKMVNED